MDTHLYKFITDFFKAVEAKSLEEVLEHHCDDAEFIDPHYPKVYMKGKEEIREGLTWGLNGVKSFSFTLINYFENKDGTSASVEYDTKIELPNGKKLNYQQVFIIETKEGKISRCQAYETYGPHGMHNVMLTVTRLKKKLGL
jgi:ketosteroid isomerase-like protein